MMSTAMRVPRTVGRPPLMLGWRTTTERAAAEIASRHASRRAAGCPRETEPRIPGAAIAGVSYSPMWTCAPSLPGQGSLLAHVSTGDGVRLVSGLRRDRGSIHREWLGSLPGKCAAHIVGSHPVGRVLRRGESRSAVVARTAKGFCRKPSSGAARSSVPSRGFGGFVVPLGRGYCQI